jgi:membrane protease YdiL (CAAX protease family)
MSLSESQSNTPTLAPQQVPIFPGPYAAFLLTLAAVFAMALVFNLMSDQPFIAALGLGEALGLGGVATLAARRVPGPHDARLGLRGFKLDLLLPLLCLLPVVFLISELDNWMRVLIPPSTEVSEMAEQLKELARIDSVYAAVQTGIVSVGIVPVVESFLFFGVVLQGLVSNLGRMRGVLLTALLYSLVHFPATGAPGDAIMPLSASLMAGVLLCIARLASGSILAPIGLAAALSAIVLVAGPLKSVFPVPGFNGEGDHTPLAIVIPSALLVLYGIKTLLPRAATAEIHFPIPDEPEPDHDFDF